MMGFTARGRWLDLTTPAVMGIVNVTPDSFSDGGLFALPDQAAAHARQLFEQGAAIIDVGGESTRPHATPVSVDEQLSRVIPVIERIHQQLDVMISIDTSEPLVIEAAVRAGAHLVNDVRGLRRPGALEAVAFSGAGVCLMHMQGEPDSMQQNPTYVDVVGEVIDYLAGRIEACLALGMDRKSLMIDPGFGFGKTLTHHEQLFYRLGEFATLDCPLLVGVSRKSMLGAWTGRPVTQRLYPGVAAAAIAVSRGAKIIRTHDVAATVDAVRVGAALRDPLEG